MAEVYGGSGPVGDTTTVRTGGTTAISAAFNISVGLVGNADLANGTASAESVEFVESSSEAATLFGEDSELKQQIDLAILNGAGEIYAAAVPETETTESFDSTSSGTLGNQTVADPRVMPEEEITALDTVESTTVTVNLVDGLPSTPTEANTMNLNPVSGEWAADESSDYDITYTYSDYSTAITNMVDESPRFLGICSEKSTDGNTALTGMNNADVGFDFMHAVVGAVPEVDPSSFSQSYNDRRMGVITSSRGYTDDAETNEQRLVGAIAGKQAGKALGDSTTQELISGFTALKQNHNPSDTSTLNDAGAYVVKEERGIRVVRDTNTSEEAKLGRFAWSEITDEVTEISHLISLDFLGEKNTEERRDDLAESHRTSYDEFVADDLLTNYFVGVSTVNDTTVDLNIGIDVVGYMDNINVTVTVGDVTVENGGAS